MAQNASKNLKSSKSKPKKPAVHSSTKKGHRVVKPKKQGKKDAADLIKVRASLIHYLLP